MRKTADLESIRVGGQNLNNIRYADNTVLFADSEEKNFRESLTRWVLLVKN